ncbi:hypothetical protein N2152v2_001857 [Parachlorella kessleri]
MEGGRSPGAEEVVGKSKDEGFVGSFYTAKVLRVLETEEGRRRYEVVYDELLEDDNETKLQERLPAARLRPLCHDDSHSKPVWDRLPGEAVDLWVDDGWWKSYVVNTYDDRIDVHFPHATNHKLCQDYVVHANPKDDPRSKEGEPPLRVRTGLDYDHTTGKWAPRPCKLYGNGRDLRKARRLGASKQRQQQQQQQHREKAGSSQQGPRPGAARPTGGTTSEKVRWLPEKGHSKSKPSTNKAGAGALQRPPSAKQPPQPSPVKAGARAGGVMSDAAAERAAEWSEDESDSSSGAGLGSGLASSRGQKPGAGGAMEGVSEPRGAAGARRKLRLAQAARKGAAPAQRPEVLVASAGGEESDTSDDMGDVPLAQRRKQQQLVKHLQHQQHDHQQPGLREKSPGAVKQGGVLAGKPPQQGAQLSAAATAKPSKASAGSKHLDRQNSVHQGQQQQRQQQPQQQQQKEEEEAPWPPLGRLATTAPAPALLELPAGPATSGSALGGTPLPAPSLTWGSGGDLEGLLTGLGGLADEPPTEAAMGSALQTVEEMVGSLEGFGHPGDPDASPRDLSFLNSPALTVAPPQRRQEQAEEAGKALGLQQRGPAAPAAGEGGAALAGKEGQADDAPPAGAGAGTAPAEGPAAAAGGGEGQPQKVLAAPQATPAAAAVAVDPSGPSSSSVTADVEAQEGAGADAAAPSAARHSGRGGTALRAADEAPRPVPGLPQAKPQASSDTAATLSQSQGASGAEAAAPLGVDEGAGAGKARATPMTEEEKATIARLVRQYGRDYDKLQEALPGRDRAHVRTFVSNNIKRGLFLGQHLTDEGGPTEGPLPGPGAARALPLQKQGSQAAAALAASSPADSAQLPTSPRHPPKPAAAAALSAKKTSPASARREAGASLGSPRGEPPNQASPAAAPAPKPFIIPKRAPLPTVAEAAEGGNALSRQDSRGVATAAPLDEAQPEPFPREQGGVLERRPSAPVQVALAQQRRHSGGRELPAAAEGGRPMEGAVLECSLQQPAERPQRKRSRTEEGVAEEVAEGNQLMACEALLDQNPQPAADEGPALPTAGFPCEGRTMVGRKRSAPDDQLPLEGGKRPRSLSGGAALATGAAPALATQPVTTAAQPTPAAVEAAAALEHVQPAAASAQPPAQPGAGATLPVAAAAAAPAAPGIAGTRRRRGSRGEDWERPEERVPPDFPTVYCMDNLGASLTTETLEKAFQGLQLSGIESVQVVSVPLDRGQCYMAGYAVVRFRSRQDAARELPRLKSLCVVTPACAIPRPLIVHEPRLASGYPWGDKAYPGHMKLPHPTNPHFAQTNSIEFDLALHWRHLSRALSLTKQRVCDQHVQQLVAVFAQYVEDVKQATVHSQQAAATGDTPLDDGTVPPPPPPGLPPPPPPAPSAPAPVGTHPSCRCLWLKGISPPARDTPEDVHQLQEKIKATLDQFGYPQRVELLRDPVTGRLSGQAVVWLDSVERAAKVEENLRDMVFLFSGTPRPLAARMAVPGPPRGSQAVYDRALREAFGRDDNSLEGLVDFLELPDTVWHSPGATLEHKAAVYLRRLMTHQQLPDMQELKALGWEHSLALAAEQQEDFEREKAKLERLKTLQARQRMMPIYQQLCTQHGLNVRIYKPSGGGALRGRGK